MMRRSGTNARVKSILTGAMLMPCPFCGGDAKLDHLTEIDDYFVSCSRCEVGQIANYCSDEAVRRWNWRTT